MDKKALTRQYKETRRPMGVFQVRNRVDGKVMIGVSVDLPAMLNRQQSQLRMGGHPNKELQRAWNEHGPEAFEFEVLDTLTPPDGPDYDPKPDLKALEELWLDKLSPYDDRGYNVRKRSS
jgi:hypothetical protein